jgi:hypothetical protein
MNKSGTQAMGATSSFVQITGWTADTTTYPGSTVSSNALVLQSAGSTTLNGSASWTSALTGTGQVRVVRNGTVAATGTATAAAASGTATVTVNITAVAGDLITLEWLYGTFTNETITVAGTFVRATAGP